MAVREEIASAVRSLSPFDSGCHHIALMRSAELVVKYQPGPVFTEAQYAGAFMTERDPEVDEAYAAAEPPTHDDWILSGLDRRQKILVNVGVRNVRAEVDGAFSATATPVGSADLTPLGPISERLAGLIAGADGPGESVEFSGKKVGGGVGRGTRSHTATVSLQGMPILTDFEGQRSAKLEFSVDANLDGDTSKLLIATLAVAILDGGNTEREQPLATESPSVLAWESEAGEFIRATDRIPIVADGSKRWRVYVSLPPEAVVSIALTIGE